MVVYSIKDLENLTGIKAHTLRIWEKRYSIIQPKRTKTNIRYYLDVDLKKIMNIALLNRNGYKISKIAGLDNSQIQSLAAELSDVDKSFENQLDGLTLSILDLNEESFLKILNANIDERGFKDAMIEVVYPLLDKLSMMWMTGSVEPVHESFVSHLIKRKCLVELDKLDKLSQNEGKFLLYLPKGENGELSLFFLHYLIKSKGFQVINLGSNVDLNQICSAYRICLPNYILTVIDDMASPVTYANYINLLSQQSGNCKILLSGLQVLKQKFSYPENFQTFQSSEDLCDYLAEIV